MRSRRPCVAVLLLFLGSILLPAPSAGAARQEVESDPESGGLPGLEIQNYMNWNLCQSACDLNEDPPGSPNVALDYALRVIQSAREPRAIAAQEICRSGRDIMDSYLEPRGYSSAFFRTKDTLRCNGDVGNAIFWKNGCPGAGCRTYQTFDDQAPEGEIRRWVCGSSDQWNAFYCSAHMTSKSRIIASQQAAQYRLASTNLRNGFGLVTVMMGDFNLNAGGGYGMTFWYSNGQHIEVDTCPGDNDPETGCKKTHDVDPRDPNAVRDRKLDYIFATAGSGYCQRPGGAPRPQLFIELSDHTRMRGYMGCP